MKKRKYNNEFKCIFVGLMSGLIIGMMLGAFFGISLFSSLSPEKVSLNDLAYDSCALGCTYSIEYLSNLSYYQNCLFRCIEFQQEIKSKGAEGK